MALAIATILFLAFSLNVGMGAFMGAPILGDVSEMLVLFAASIFFVAAILRREARAQKNDKP